MAAEKRLDKLEGSEELKGEIDIAENFDKERYLEYKLHDTLEKYVYFLGADGRL